MKLVSDIVCNVTLGSKDPNAEGPGKDRRIDSWKKAVTTLNNAAISVTGISTARSIAIEDIEKITTIKKGEEYEKEFSYSTGTYKNTYYSGELDKDELGVLASKQYWLASTYISCEKNIAKCGVRRMSYGGLYGYSFVILTNTSGAIADNANIGVRAIFYI